MRRGLIALVTGFILATATPAFPQKEVDCSKTLQGTLNTITAMEKKGISELVINFGPKNETSLSELACVNNNLLRKKKDYHISIQKVIWKGEAFYRYILHQGEYDGLHIHKKIYLGRTRIG